MAERATIAERQTNIVTFRDADRRVERLRRLTQKTATEVIKEALDEKIERLERLEVTA